MLKKTPFFSVHQREGGKIVEFAGFEMPVQYKGIKVEHAAVREAVGVFDVSHMGEFFVSGPEALNLIQKVTVNDTAKLVPGKAQYSCMCYEDGGIVDDLIVYKFDDDDYMLVVNGANIDKDFEWISSQNTMGATLVNKSDDWALLAVQGPKSEAALQKLTDVKLGDIPFYGFTKGSLAGVDMIISATGYTGEKGFELYFEHGKTDATAVWDAIFEAGAEFGIEPCGLGSRDALRLEMGYALYGNDITKDTHPLESRLGWITKMDASEFVGKEALQTKKEVGLTRSLVGFVMEDERSIPRHDYEILNEEGEKIGFVTSGTMSLSLGKGIGMGFVEKQYSTEGSSIQIAIRTKQAAATVQRPPFIKN